MARVEVRIDCSPAEFRRLAGRPHLLPLYETVAIRQERLLVREIAGLGRPGDEMPAEARVEPRRATPPGPRQGDGPGAG